MKKAEGMSFGYIEFGMDASNCIPDESASRPWRAELDDGGEQMFSEDADRFDGLKLCFIRVNFKMEARRVWNWAVTGVVGL